MNVLIVDDDRFIIGALEKKIPWETLEIENVFTALNMKQAQSIIKEHSINLLISDIEMPQGSGLQLLSWIREEDYEIQAIFLTNYADFNYAQKAIELQSFEYYLKPIDFDKLYLIIKRAIERIKAENIFKLKTLDIHQKQMIEQSLWYEYLRKPNPELFPQLQKEATQSGIILSKKNTYYPLVLSIDQLHKLSKKREGTWSTYLQKTIQIFLNFKKNVDIASFFKMEGFEERYFLLLKSSILSDNYFTYLGKELKQELQKQLIHPIQIINGEPSSVQTLLNNTKKLYLASQLFVGEADMYCLINDLVSSQHSYKGLPETIHQFILSKDEKQIITCLKNEIERYQYHSVIQTEILKNLRLDFIQKIDIYLDSKGILAHKLFQNEEHEYLLKCCFNSKLAFLRYLSYYIHKSFSYLSLLSSKQSIAKMVSDYIDHHFMEEISRKSLAETVFLSPDHVSRLFKKETGLTLIAYITNKRIDTAKQLLIYSTEPVYLVASQVGYDNYSYFSKIFKKETGLTPIKFREKNSKFV